MELDSDEELDNHLRVQARSRGGRWSWTLMKSWTIIFCLSRRDQEEGGGAGPSREPRNKSRAGRWSWVRKVGQRFASVVPRQLLYGHCPCDFSPQHLSNFILRLSIPFSFFLFLFFSFFL